MSCTCNPKKCTDAYCRLTCVCPCHQLDLIDQFIQQNRVAIDKLSGRTEPIDFEIEFQIYAAREGLMI